MRHKRVRRKIVGTPDRPRMSVFRSLNHIYVQVIDDANGHTVAAASSLDPEVKSQVDGDSAKTAVSTLVGKLLANRAVEKGVKGVVFDRGGFKYHGRTKALADAAREGGLVF
jgi:large subunit ribosomal protein L18